MQLRTARREDAPALAGLMTQLGYPTSPTQMAARLGPILADDDYHTVVAEVAGRVVGMVGVRRGAYYEHDGGYGQIVALVVDDASRDQGIGSRLVAEAERWLAALSIDTSVVTSGAARADAHRFYERHGFQPTGIRFVKRGSSGPA